jgi:hypothetical protein
MLKESGKIKKRIAKALYLLSFFMGSFCLVFFLLRRYDSSENGGKEKVLQKSAKTSLSKKSIPKIPPPPGLKKNNVLPGNLKGHGGLFESKADAEKVEGFYKAFFVKNGWKENVPYAKSLSESSGMNSMVFEKNNFRCMIETDIIKEGGTAVVIRVFRSLK